MTTLQQGSTGRLAGPAGTMAMLAAGAMAVLVAVVLLAQDGPPTADYETLGGIIHELGTLAFLVATMAAVVAAQHRGRTTVAPVRLIIVGYGLIALGVAAGLALRDDPDWFFLLGGPGNLLAGIGFVWWGVAAWRRRLLPRFAAVLVAVGGFVAILGAEAGTTLLIGAFWLWLAGRGAVDPPQESLALPRPDKMGA